MSRHLNNLKRLLAKLQRRYGDDDDLVRQLTSELAVAQTLEAGQRLCVVPNVEFSTNGTDSPTGLVRGQRSGCAIQIR